MKILGVAGLPASGKSTWAQAQAAQHPATQVFDDTWYTVAFGEFLNALKESVQRTVTSNAQVIIVGVDLCLPDRRKFLVDFLSQYDVDIEWIFFENDPAQCHINASLRPQKDVRATIDLFTRIYRIPEGAKTYPCYRGQRRAEDI